MNKLPMEVLSVLNNEKRDNKVIFLLTLDSDYYPHVSILSPYQMKANERGDIMFFVHSNSRTRSNLIERGKATIIFIVPPKCIYIKGKSSFIRNFDGESLFSFSANEVKVDYSEVSPIISDVKFNDERVKGFYLKLFNMAFH